MPRRTFINMPMADILADKGELQGLYGIHYVRFKNIKEL